MLILSNEPMFQHTTMRVGGRADLFVRVTNAAELKAAIRYAAKMPVFVMGNGSNLIFTDKGFRGCVIQIATAQIHHENNLLICDAGVAIETAILYSILHGLAGVECLTGIPGTIGGAVCMNAGYTKEIGGLIHHVTAIDFQGRERSFARDELKLGFRRSIFQSKQYVITEVALNMHNGEIYPEVQRLTERRKKTQPVRYASAGTVFRKNGLAAFQGWKYGDAEVRKSYIINHGENNAQDVTGLIRLIRENSTEKLELEVEIIGEE